MAAAGGVVVAVGCRRRENCGPGDRIFLGFFGREKCVDSLAAFYMLYICLYYVSSLPPVYFCCCCCLDWVFVWCSFACFFVCVVYFFNLLLLFVMCTDASLRREVVVGDRRGA